MKKFEIDIGQLVSNEEVEEKVKKEKIQKSIEMEGDRVNVYLIIFSNIYLFLFYLSFL